MESGRAAQAAGEWQKALDAYLQAGQLNRTPAGQAEISQARSSLYQSVMDAGSQAEAADTADKWQKALTIYQMAVKINNTVDARAGITRATEHLPHEPTPYEQALEAGRKAQATGEWQKALNAYVQAGQLDRTPAGQAEIGQARKSLYDAVMAAGKEAEASDAADKWPKVLEIYQMAAKIVNTVEARAGITRATGAISGRETPAPPMPRESTPYGQALETGRKAQAAGDWQNALDAYVQAGQLNKSPMALRQIGQARKSLYDAVMAAGRKAEASEDPEMWTKALEAYEMAAKVVNTPEVKVSIARIKEKRKIR
jgi:tetratricopeptide (TPR) repeat protein